MIELRVESGIAGMGPLCRAGASVLVIMPCPGRESRRPDLPGSRRMALPAAPRACSFLVTLPSSDSSDFPRSSDLVRACSATYSLVASRVNVQPGCRVLAPSMSGAVGLASSRQPPGPRLILVPHNSKISRRCWRLLSTSMELRRSMRTTERLTVIGRPPL